MKREQNESRFAMGNKRRGGKLHSFSQARRFPKNAKKFVRERGRRKLLGEGPQNLEFGGHTSRRPHEKN